MLIGHYGAGFGLKRFAPGLSLGVIFLAVQIVDILWAVLVLTGIERVRITPGFTVAVPLESLYQPFSHSLASSIIIAVAAYLLFRLRAGGDANKAKTALVLGIAVFSHFLLDIPVHAPDLPLLGWDTYRLGFGLWNYPIAAYALEWCIYIAGLVLYLRFLKSQAGARKYTAAIFGILLLALGVFTSFAPPPKSGKELALSLLLIYLIAAVLAFYIDGRRKGSKTAA